MNFKLNLLQFVTAQQRISKKWLDKLIQMCYNYVVDCYSFVTYLVQ